MADLTIAFWDTGTVSVGSGSTAVTGVGTNWLAAGIEPGDELHINGLAQRILSVNSATSITLMNPWVGAAVSGLNYYISRTPDAERVMQWARLMINAIESGGLAAMADLNGEANKFPYYTGPSTMALTGITSQARSLLASSLLSVSGNNLVTGGTARITGGAVTSSNMDATSGKVMRVGDFGIGLRANLQSGNIAAANLSNGIYAYNSGTGVPDGPDGTSTYYHALICVNGNDPAQRRSFLDFRVSSSGSSPTAWIGTNSAAGDISWALLRTSANTTVDSNGFLKSASPIVRLFRDKIEEPVQPTGAVMSRIGVGHYELSDTLGLAQEGWQIEVPRCPNGNRLVFVETVYADGVLTVRTSVPVFDNGLWVAGTPVDVPEGRWVDVRLHEEPVPEQPTE